MSHSGDADEERASGGTGGVPAPLRGLLPHERRAAQRASAIYEEAPHERSNQNYGPKGVALMLAAKADMWLAFAVGVVSMFVFAVPALRVLGIALIVAAVALAGLLFARCLQSSAEGRKFRGRRPYLTRPPRRWR